jgi:SAM-dependent methyltransferase
VKFSDVKLSIRETYQCDECKASLRERVTADAIISVYGRGQERSLSALISKNFDFKSLNIYEVGVSGAYRTFFSKHKKYTNSFFWEAVSLGSEKEGVRCEDLTSLTFPDTVFDLVITSDIFEHVRKPWMAFDEIHRVLKSGGYHIFSIPTLTPMPAETIYRFDTNGDDDKHILEPRYHGDGRGGSSLVYTDFGADIFQTLQKRGFDTFSITSDHLDRERHRVNAFISRKSC